MIKDDNSVSLVPLRIIYEREYLRYEYAYIMNILEYKHIFYETYFHKECKIIS